MWDAVVGLASALGGTVLATAAVALRVQLKKLVESALSRLSGLGTAEQPKQDVPEQPPKPDPTEQQKPVASVQGQPQSVGASKLSNPLEA